MSVPRVVAAGGRSESRKCTGSYCGNSDVTAWARSAQQWLTVMERGIAGAQKWLESHQGDDTDERTQLLASMVTWTMPQFSPVPSLAKLDDLPFKEIPYLLSQYGTMTDADVVDLQVREILNGRDLLVRAEKLFPISSAGDAGGVKVEATGTQKAEESEATAYEYRWVKWVAGGLALAYGYSVIFGKDRGPFG